MNSGYPLAWRRALETSGGRPAAVGLSSFLGWPRAVDTSGRNVWMATLMWGMADAWPHLASKPGAWEIFDKPDVQGRSVLDYLVAAGFSSKVKPGGWADEVRCRLEESARLPPGIGLRLSKTPLLWNPAPQWPIWMIRSWSQEVLPSAWQFDGTNFASLVHRDLESGGNLWAWVQGFPLSYWEKSLHEKAWVWALWAACRKKPVEDPIALERVLSNRVVAPAERALLSPYATKWAMASKRPSVRALALELSWSEAKENGRRSARF